MSRSFLLPRISPRRRQAATTLSVVAVVIGALAFFNALGEPFFIPGGVRLWRLIFMGQAGGLITVALGLCGLIGAVTRRASVVLVAGIGFAAATGLTLVTLGTPANLLGGRADTLVLWLLETVGLITLVTVPDPEV